MNPGRARRATGWALSDQVAAVVQAAARAAAPREACGVLLGTRNANGGHVQVATLGRNLADADDAFELDPADYLAAEATACADGLAVVGFWHSHVASAAVPSARDLAAAWAGHLMLIVGPLADPSLSLWLPARADAEFAPGESQSRG